MYSCTRQLLHFTQKFHTSPQKIYIWTIFCFIYVDADAAASTIHVCLSSIFCYQNKWKEDSIWLHLKCTLFSTSLIHMYMISFFSQNFTIQKNSIESKTERWKVSSFWRTQSLSKRNKNKCARICSRAQQSNSWVVTHKSPFKSSYMHFTL